MPPRLPGFPRRRYDRPIGSRSRLVRSIIVRPIGTLMLAVISASLIAVPAMAADCPMPPDLGDGWTVAAPEQEGLNSALICSIGPRLEALKEARAHGVVIARHGRLIYEHYFDGQDQRIGRSLGDVSFDAETKHDIRSISKSVTSLLVGTALDWGLLTDLDARLLVLSRIRGSAYPRKGSHHPATSSYDVLRSCLGRDEPPHRNLATPYWQMGIAPCSPHFVLPQPLSASPGQVFNYNT